jgi:hypothetical protein
MRRLRIGSPTWRLTTWGAVHFMRVHENGLIYKAYENDGVSFPTDVLGAIEGQPVCRKVDCYAVFRGARPVRRLLQYTDTPRGTYGALLKQKPRTMACSR